MEDERKSLGEAFKAEASRFARISLLKKRKALHIRLLG
jgi:hypothetical protein